LFDTFAAMRATKGSANKTSSKKTATARKTPAALVKRAAAAHEAGLARRTDAIRQLIASAKRRTGDLAGTFWDLGRDLVALRKLKPETVLTKYKTFYAVCEGECGLSESFVSEAMDIAESMVREQAILLGTQSRARAFLDLARLTPEDDDAVGLAQRGYSSKTLKLPPNASARQAEEVVKRLRQAQKTNSSKKSVGRTTTAEERDLAESIARTMKKGGFAIEVRAVAGLPGKPCTYAIRFLSRAGMTLLRKALPAR
jgi:hypothetical protein